MADFVTAAGLKIKTIEEIVNELSTQQRQEINAVLNTEADSPIGLLNGIFASQLREAWEVIQVAYNAFNPDAAEGFLLEKLAALTGTQKRPATKSTVTLTVDLDASTTLLAGTHFANLVGDPTNRWTPVADYTAAVGGAQPVVFEAEFVGEVAANAGTITEINTAVVGWNTVTNASDATLGTEADTDAQLRQRREDELRAAGSATVDAIRSDILQVEDVEQVTVLENTSSIVDTNGLPPKSFEVIVFDGTPPAVLDNVLAQAIWDTKPAGILAAGTTSGTATDSLGVQHTIKFSRPLEREVWLELDLDINQVEGYAGSAALKEALIALNTSTFFVGRDVIVNAIECVAMSFAGVIDVTATRLGLAASPVNTANLVMTPREIARLDTGRITIAENFIAVP